MLFLFPGQAVIPNWAVEWRDDNQIAFFEEKKMLSFFLRSGWFTLRKSYDKDN